MKRLLVVAMILTTLSSITRADYQAGSQTLNLQFGGSITNNQIDWTKVRSDFGKDKVADPGGAVGGQYLYFVHAQPAIGLGLDLDYSGLKEHTASSVLPNFDSKSTFHPFTILAIGHLGMSSGIFRPYLMGGLGLHTTAMGLSLTPKAGTTWSDTHTTEERKIIDGSGTGFAGAFGLGADLFPTESFLIGLEYRIIYLGSTTYSATTAGQNLGFTSPHTDLSLSNFLVRVGLKFGV